MREVIRARWPGYGFAQAQVFRERAGVLRAPTWRVVVPNRLLLFHLPGQQPALPARAVPEPTQALQLTVEGAA